MGLFNPWAILDVAMDRLGSCRGPFWTFTWAVLDQDYRPFWSFPQCVYRIVCRMFHACILQLNDLAVPDHWMKYFFIAQVYLELQLNQDALRCYEKLRSSHFACSTYVMSQLALACHNIRGVYQCLLILIKKTDDDNDTNCENVLVLEPF